MNQFILALCGLPASGKSVLAEAIQKALKFEVEIVGTDDWRDNDYYTEWKPEKEGPVRQAALDRVKKLVEQGKSVIHDDTNYYSSMRHELLKIAIASRCGFSIIHVTTPVTVALQWNRKRADTRIPDSVIEAIFERFDVPGRRYLWDNSDLEVNMESQELISVIPEIMDILDELEPALEPVPKIVTNIEFERLDTETRLIVSKFLEEHPEQRGNREVSTIRRSVLRTANNRSVSIKEVSTLLWAELLKLI
jgi:O-phosphoseryl-tRNA(Sec) kinase